MCGTIRCFRRFLALLVHQTDHHFVHQLATNLLAAPKILRGQFCRCKPAKWMRRTWRVFGLVCLSATDAGKAKRCRFRPVSLTADSVQKGFCMVLALRSEPSCE